MPTEVLKWTDYFVFWQPSYSLFLGDTFNNLCWLYCLFSEEFFKPSDRSESLQHSPFFKIGGTPILKINEQQREFLNTIFRKMIEEQKTDYAYKDDLIRNYINLIIHEALKLQPSENYDQHKNAAIPHYQCISGTFGKTISY